MVLKSKHLKTKIQRLAFVLRGKNRRDIIRVLFDGQKTANEISSLTGISISNVCRVLNELKRHSLITNLTPNLNRGQIYDVTPLTFEFKDELELHLQIRREGRD
ncbi:MAG: winged helix-turn-helix domain-containing protein [Candidatus Hodarchaeota archaeon]